MSYTVNNDKEVVNILSDDDNECSIESIETVDLSVDNSTIKPSGTSVIDTVVLDEEDNIDINVNIKLQMTNMAGSSGNKKSCHTCDSKTLKIDTLNLDNMLLCEVIELCLQLENSPFMMKFLKNKVLKWYQQANMEYRKSKRFNRMLMKTKRCLKNNPQCKYSYIEMMCDNLKSHMSQKNKAQLVTLATSLNDFNKKRTQLNNAQNSPKKQKTVLIDLDSEEKTSNVINLDDYTFDVAIVNNSVSKHQGKENKTEVIDLDCIETNNINKNGNDILLTPKLMEHVVDNDLRNALTDEEIIKIKEREIVKYRNMIEELEKQEVDNDTFESPYIKCEKLKEKIVSLYKEICLMIGSATVKRRQVRLKVLDGHPPGPVSLLQEFLNNNIGENGYTTFPDFLDVLKCVKDANIKDNLGWNPAQVQEEARRLFVQCGEALQRKRQHREWRDLTRWLGCEDDPADGDAALRARLEANRKVGARNEAALIRRYSMIQSTKPEGKVINNSNTLRANKKSFLPSRHEKGTSLISDTANCSKVSLSIKPGRRVSVNSDTLCVNSKKSVLSDEKLSMQDSNVSSCAGNSNKVSQATEFKGKLQDNSVTLKVDSEPFISIEDTENVIIRDSSVIPDAGNSSKVSQVTEFEGKLRDNCVTLDVKSEPDISIEDTEKNIRDSSVVSEVGSSKISQVTELKGKLQDNSHTLGEPILIEDKEKSIIRDSSVILDAGNTKKVSLMTCEIETVPNIKIKEEPVEKLMSEFQEFGDNFTTEILDIEDPFLVIEISSDSSSSDEEELG